MTRQTDDKARQTLDVMQQLYKDGIKKASVLLRHSERFYSKDPGLEPFMSLTPPGQTLAFDFGKTLSNPFEPKLYSSFIGRCIETAYLIDKGFTTRHNLQLVHTQTHKMLSPFYINDIQKVIAHVERTGNPQFLRDWFDKKLDKTIIRPPEETADCLCEFMLERLDRQKENQISLCVSHDWNIYPLKEFKLGLSHETAGDVGYLEGLIFFEKDNQNYMTGYQSDPVPI